MNSFFYDEISALNTAFKSAEKTVEVIGDCFGLGKYVSELSKRSADRKEKVMLFTLDFAKENNFSADDFFKDLEAGTELVFIEVADFEDGFPDGVTALAERELGSLVSYDSRFRTAEKIFRFENELKKYTDSYNIKVLRYTNIYGPECISSGTLSLIIELFRENKQIELSKCDYRSYISVSYISTVISDILSVIRYGKRGNIYNGTNSVCTVAEIKNIMYKLFASEGASLKFNEADDICDCYSALSCRKIGCIYKAAPVSLEESLCKTLCDNEDFYLDENLKKIYDGKINYIREEEKSILLEVDRICKKHNINYYLVGGSLLGAVRHGGFIPWDDDVDICMLREDFETFRKVCPSELSEKYAYQSYRNEKTTHYIYDKIRLKGTYFSSEHSGKYDDMQNGIFMDIFVFDKTSNIKLMQKLHVFFIVMLRRLIHIRWTEEPVTGKFAFVSKLILPLVCLLPYSFYHKFFEFILRFYEKSRKSRFVLDGIGLYVKKGALPLSWVTGNKLVSFEGMTLPGVSDSNSYLSMWYTDDYMTPPVLSKRMSGHSFSRLDLGEYLYNKGENKEISLEGELYDK